MQNFSEKHINKYINVHNKEKEYGKTAIRWVNTVWDIIEKTQCSTILDYGCGKGVISTNIAFFIKNYDPAIKAFCQMPPKAEFVICINVLECVEPEFLNNVLDHLEFLTEKGAFIVIDTKPSPITMLNGENEYTNLKSVDEWKSLILKHFLVLYDMSTEDELVMIVGHKMDEIERQKIHPENKDLTLNQINIGE